ncbi:MAG: GerW family sporulation protein [Bacteroidetes bacterium]|nr:GerW family sporulation protein [Bacteroidota bacterium]
MNEHFDDVISKLADFLKEEGQTKTVVGEEFRLGEFSCVPVIRLGIGFGFGRGEGEGDNAKSGKGKGEGGGGAGGTGIEPLGFLVTRGDHIQFISTHATKGLSVLFEKAPDLLAKYFETKEPEVAHTA